MIVLNKTKEDSLQVLRNLYCEKAYDRFSYNAHEDEMNRLIFIRNLLIDDNQFFLGSINTMCSNLTSLWLFEHQGYSMNDSLKMSLFRCERGWESYLNDFKQWTKMSKTDDELDPWRKKRRFFKLSTLYGMNIHRVHPHKDVAIISFIFSDGYNEFQTKQCIVKKHHSGKYYVSQDAECSFVIKENDFTHLYPQFNLI